MKRRKKVKKPNSDLCDIYCSFKPVISTFKEDHNTGAFGFKTEKKLLKVRSFNNIRKMFQNRPANTANPVLDAT